MRESCPHTLPSYNPDPWPGPELGPFSGAQAHERLPAAAPVSRGPGVGGTTAAPSRSGGSGVTGRGGWRGPHHHQHQHGAGQHSAHAAPLGEVGFLLAGDGVQGCRGGRGGKLGPWPLLEGSQCLVAASWAVARVWGPTHLDVLVVEAAPAVGQRGALPFPVLQEQHCPQGHEHAEEDGAAVVEEPAGLWAGRVVHTRFHCWPLCASVSPLSSGSYFGSR